MTTEATLCIEIETKNQHYIRDLLPLVERIESSPDSTRREVEALIEATGQFAAYVGGSHVAIHFNENGKLGGERLALITGDSSDWR